MPRKKKVDTDVVKTKTLFDHLNAITKERDPNYWETLTEGDRKTFTNYMVLRYMSMVEEWLDTIAYLQPHIQDLPPNLLYKVLIDVFPPYRGFIKYISGEKVDKYEKWLVDLFSKHYTVSKKEIDTYLKILYLTDEGKSHILEVCEMYGVDPKLIKSLKL
jgi:hypothetical protein